VHSTKRVPKNVVKTQILSIFPFPPEVIFLGYNACEWTQTSLCNVNLLSRFKLGCRGLKKLQKMQLKLKFWAFFILLQKLFFLDIMLVNGLKQACVMLICYLDSNWGTQN